MLLGTAVDGVEDLDNRIDAADDRVVLIDKGCQLLFEDILDFLDDIGTGSVHDRDPSGNVCLTVG